MPHPKALQDEFPILLPKYNVKGCVFDHATVFQDKAGFINIDQIQGVGEAAAAPLTLPVISLDQVVQPADVFCHKAM